MLRFVFGPCFVMLYFVSFLVLQSFLGNSELIALLKLYSCWFSLFDLILYVPVSYVRTGLPGLNQF